MESVISTIHLNLCNGFPPSQKHPNIIDFSRSSELTDEQVIKLCSALQSHQSFIGGLVFSNTSITDQVYQ